MSHVVTAPLVIAKDGEGKDVYLYQGSAVPANVDSEQVARFVGEGFFAKVGQEPPVEQTPGVVEEPAGNASREEWAVFASSKGASEDETADGGLSRNDLRDKYSS